MNSQAYPCNYVQDLGTYGLGHGEWKRVESWAMGLNESSIHLGIRRSPPPTTHGIMMLSMTHDLGCQWHYVVL